jgi:ribosomal protein S18 acetylase RimI-like enzyme
MDIREAKPGDVAWPQVAKLFRRAVGWLEDPGETGEYRFFVATGDSGSLLGGSVIEIGTLRFGPLSDVSAGFLEDIAVLESHRREGVGAALLHASLGCAWQAGCESVRANVAYDATAAISLYRSAGFGFIPEEDPDAEQPDKLYSIVVSNPARLKTRDGEQ